MKQPSLQTLADRYHADPSPINRERVVTASIPLVRSIIGRLHVPSHPCVTYEDLQGTGLLGLIEALDRYDPSYGNSFTTFAFLRIRGAMVDYLRLVDALPRSRRSDLAKAQKAREQVAQERGAEPRDKEVADFLGISLTKYRRLISDARSRTFVSLHREGGDEAEMPLEDVVRDDDALQRHERFEMGTSVDYLAAPLSERDRQIIHLYYHEGCTQREIAAIYGITEARISQIMGRILRTMRKRHEQALPMAA